jgi:hypothetical protein
VHSSTGFESALAIAAALNAHDEMVEALRAIAHSAYTKLTPELAQLKTIARQALAKVRS